MAFPTVPGYSQYSGNLIPILWAKKLLERFYDATVFAEISNTDYQGEIRNQGDTVRINQIPDITISNYQAGQALTYEIPPVSTLDLLIDQGKYWAFQLDDVMDVQAAISMMGPWATNASEQLKIAVDTNCLAFILDKCAAENRGATAGAVSGNVNLGTVAAPVSITKANAIEYIVDLGQVLDEQSIPETGRKLVIPAWMAGQMKKSDLKAANITGDDTAVMRNGRIGMVDRFEVYVSNLLPNVTGATPSTTVYACTQAANTFAAQLTKTEQLRSQTTFGDLMRGLMVFGRACVNPVAMAQGQVVRG
jgi:hypothetical protein